MNDELDNYVPQQIGSIPDPYMYQCTSCASVGHVKELGGGRSYVTLDHEPHCMWYNRGKTKSNPAAN